MPRYNDNTFYMKCPGCGQSKITFIDYGTIEVTAESTQDVFIPGLMTLDKGCQNPFCKWSNVKK